jgi:hypothetical protein
MSTPVRDAWAEIRRGLIVAGAFLGASATLKLLSPDHLGPEFATRGVGVLMGLIVAGYANATPKTLAPLARMRCNPATEQALRRFVAWSLTLGGLAYAGAWLVAPLEIANVLATSLLATSMIFVIARLARGRFSRSRA